MKAIFTTRGTWSNSTASYSRYSIFVDDRTCLISAWHEHAIPAREEKAQRLRENSARATEKIATCNWWKAAISMNGRHENNGNIGNGLSRRSWTIFLFSFNYQTWLNSAASYLECWIETRADESCNSSPRHVPRGTQPRLILLLAVGRLKKAIPSSIDHPSSIILTLSAFSSIFSTQHLYTSKTKIIIWNGSLVQSVEQSVVTRSTGVQITHDPPRGITLAVNKLPPEQLLSVQLRHSP